MASWIGLSVLLLAYLQLGWVEAQFDPGNYAGSRSLNPEFTVYWKVDELRGRLNLAFVVRTIGWFGFGFGESTSGSMPGSDIMTITYDNGIAKPDIMDRYADEFAAPHVDSCQDWTIISFAQVAGITTVEVSRVLNTQDAQDREVLPGGTRVVYAYGTNSNLALSYHQTRRGATIINFFTADGGIEEPFPETDVVSADMFVGNFAVPAKRTTYACRSVHIPIPTGSADRHVIKMEPILDPTNQLAHHMLIHICANVSATSYVNRYYQSPQQCVSPVGDANGACFSLLYSWAIGIDSLILPKEAGYRMGYSEQAFQYVVIEIHYDNPGLVAGLVDNSGFRIYYTEQLRKYDAGTLTIGDALVKFPNIPPGSPSNPYEASCPSECTNKFTGELHVFADFLHMHALGKQIWTTQHRNGEFVRTLNRAEFYSYDFQQQTPQNVTIRPGDLLNLHCIFDSSHQTSPTSFGVESTQEMCMDFVSYYPKMLIKNRDFAYCGYFRSLLTTYTLCGSGEGIANGESILDIRNPTFSDMEQGLERTFGQEGPCVLEMEQEQHLIETGLIIGGVVLGVAFVAFVIAGFTYLNKRKLGYQPIKGI